MNLFFIILNDILNIKFSLLYLVYIYIIVINGWEKNILFIFLWSFFYDIFFNFFLGRSFLVYFLSTYIIFYLKKKIVFSFFLKDFFFIIFFSFLIRMISFWIDNVVLNNNVNNVIWISSIFDGFLWFFIVNILLKKK